MLVLKLNRIGFLEYTAIAKQRAVKSVLSMWIDEQNINYLLCIEIHIQYHVIFFFFLKKRFKMAEVI